MIKPNYDHSILSLSSSLSNFLGKKSDNATLKSLDKYLNDDIKGIIFIIFDGLGVYNVNLATTKNTYYKDHIIDEISSTMPATTTAATTTLLSNKYPDEHLWLDWSLYLEEQKRVVEIYLSRDYHTGEKVNPYNMPVEFFLDSSKTDRKLYTVAPSYAYYSDIVEAIHANSLEELFDSLNTLATKKEKFFAYCYSPEPDSSMHSFGIDSPQAISKFEEIQEKLEILMNNKDLLVITTADHGHINVKRYIEIQNDKELMDMQDRPLSMEPRFASFKIKKGMHDAFVEHFNKHYGKYFILLSYSQIIENKLFGNNSNEERVKKYVGDYIAIGNEEFYAFNLNATDDLLVGLHAGATKEEMTVPVCVFKS